MKEVGLEKFLKDRPGLERWRRARKAFRWARTACMLRLEEVTVNPPVWIDSESTSLAICLREGVAAVSFGRVVGV